MTDIKPQYYDKCYLEGDGQKYFKNLYEVIYGRTLRNESNRAIWQNKRFKKIMLSVP